MAQPLTLMVQVLSRTDDFDGTSSRDSTVVIEATGEVASGNTVRVMSGLGSLCCFR